jgi:hypothetical protein
MATKGPGYETEPNMTEQALMQSHRAKFLQFNRRNRVIGITVSVLSNEGELIDQTDIQMATPHNTSTFEQADNLVFAQTGAHIREHQRRGRINLSGYELPSRRRRRR